MKTILHQSNTRGFADHGWLKTYHTFSFANYHNPERVHFGALRVLNDDTVSSGNGFPTHGHDNMEIISIPLKGSLAHKDSTGTAETIKSGEVQIMSAGTGIRHAEFNPSETDSVNFLQLWIFPEKENIKPRYEQKMFSEEHASGRLGCVVAPDGRDGSLWINQDAFLYVGKLASGVKIEQTLAPDHGAYIFLISGKLKAIEIELTERDGIGISETSQFSLEAIQDSHVLLIDVPLF